jgi:hypothetical protein
LKKLDVIISPTAQNQYIKILEYLDEEWPEKVKVDFEMIIDEKKEIDLGEKIVLGGFKSKLWANSYNI